MIEENSMTIDFSRNLLSYFLIHDKKMSHRFVKKALLNPKICYIMQKRL
ncbi:MAG: hypothetical protein H6Q59_607 [Firmicutes bacterium]|nr:hypothetical protein [Bacillota bacterium]